MLRRPMGVMAAHEANAARVNKAFDAYTGNPDGEGGTGTDGQDPEKIEEESYAEIQSLIGEMEKILMRLKDLHQQPAEKEGHVEEVDAGPTGSPSAQGAV